MTATMLDHGMSLHNYNRRQLFPVFIALVCLVRKPLHAFRGVAEGDKTIEFFVNGVYIRPDESLPFLPLNGQRRYPTANQGAFPIFMSRNFEPGDVLGLKIKTDRVLTVNWTTNIGTLVQYPGLGAGIAAFEDGTLTNERWRCSVTFEENWFVGEFDDSQWPFAVVQDRGCCPWRDVTWKWKRLNAKWIAPSNFDASGDGIGYCRYVIPSGDRLMDGSQVDASISAPSFNVSAVVFVQHAAGVMVSVGGRSIVSCILCDSRFILRTPSPLEIEAANFSMDVNGWTDVTVGNHLHHYDIVALQWHHAETYLECQDICDNYVSTPPCTAITFFTSGLDPSTAKNCKLMEFLDNSKLRLNVSLSPRMVKHIARQTFPTSKELSIPGLLFPSTLYTAYCTVRSFYTNKHSTWPAVEASRFTGRTGGNTAGGSAPVVKIMGGWASDDAISPIVWSSQIGRVFCAARPLSTEISPFTLTIEEIKASSIQQSRHWTLTATDASSAFVSVTGLSPLTLYEIACLAETDTGDLSTQANLEETRQRWYTEAIPVPIAMLTVVRNEWNDADVSKVSLDTNIRMRVIGLIWCQIFNISYLMNNSNATPNRQFLKENGALMAVTDVKSDAFKRFPLPSATLHHQLICTGNYDDFSNMSGIVLPGQTIDFPVASILRYTVDLDEVRLVVHLDRGPTSTYCRAYQWARRPFSYQPLLPEIAHMKESPYYKSTFNSGGAGFELVLPGLASGSFYDIFCYAEDYVPPPPPGSLPPASKGMDAIALERTRITIKTPGPTFNEGGWNCTVGHSCKIWNIEALDSLTSDDKLLVQETQCAGRCLCNGIEDEDRKGATCSQVSHERPIVPPDPLLSGPPGLDAIDPRGSWCYVMAGTCYDQVPSPTFDNLFISYAACDFQNLTGTPGSAPADFPYHGIARLASNGGDAYDFGVDPLFVRGAAYPLCWCNGTTSLCRTLADYNLPIGLLHVAGPTAEQKASVMRCVAGKPCVLRHFSGHALSDGNRLVVLPDTSQGCRWQPESIGHLLTLPGFPQDATTGPATDAGTTYSWGDVPVRADGGTYLLCWCGSMAGLSYERTPNCPFPRPLDGTSYLAPAGRLMITGPLVGSMRFCNVGIECVIEGVPGEGLQGGDKLAILNVCGRSSEAPGDWTAGVDGIIPPTLSSRFVPDGWIQYGPPMTDSELIAFGVPPHSSNISSRGVFGVPNHGISVSDARPGYYAWVGAIGAKPGDYMLCWCSREYECSTPEEFQVLVGAIRLRGPLVLPSASQSTICVRNRRCQVLNITGVWPAAGGQLFIAGSTCGGPVALGAPRNGISMTSSNGKTFTWGQEVITSPPGKFRLCWCFRKFACTDAAQFGSFAGILLVKAPFGPLRQFYCGIAQPCLIQDVFGEGSSPTDQVMAMAVCGDGDGATQGFEQGPAVSNRTGPDGTWFEMPAPVTGGRYRICWCAGETLCARGSDFDHDLGELITGGPDNSALYVCYEWSPCSISGLIGTSLSNGDRVLVIPATTHCNEPSLAVVPGFPQQGLGAPASDGGTTHHFGNEKVRSKPGVYHLCYCSVLFTGGVCNGSSLFNLMAGQLRIGTAAEAMFLGRTEPEDRSEDSKYFLLLLAPVVLACCGFLCFGVRRIKTLQQHNKEKLAPEPFPRVLTDADRHRARRKNEHAVLTIECQRKITNGTADESHKKKGVQMLAIPDQTGVTASPLFHRLARPPLLSLEDVADNKNKPQLMVEDLTASPSAFAYGSKEEIEDEPYISTTPRSSCGQGGYAPVHPSSPDSKKQKRGFDASQAAKGTASSKLQRFMGIASSKLFGSWSRDPTRGQIEIREIRHPSYSPEKLAFGTEMMVNEHVSPLRRVANEKTESPSAQAIQASTRLEVSSPFSISALNVDLDAGLEIEGVVSPAHLFRFERDPRRERELMRILDL